MPTVSSGLFTSGAETGNNLLRAMSSADFNLIRPLLERGQMRHGEIIYEAGDNVTTVHFPCGSSLVSYSVVMPNGESVESALIGHEGVVGGIVSHGFVPSFSRSIVRSAGPFLRVDARRLEEAKHKSITLRHLFARYADCLLAQVFQSVACNAVHSIEQRCARWLAMSHERRGQTELPLTQEQFAELLGVGRGYISRVLQSFTRRGTIKTGRGRIVILDASALDAAACACNRLVESHFDVVLRGVYPDENDS